MYLIACKDSEIKDAGMMWMCSKNRIYRHKNNAKLQGKQIRLYTFIC